MAKNDFTTKLEDGRIIFMTSYRNEFGETCEVANVITKEKLIEIRDSANNVLKELEDGKYCRECDIILSDVSIKQNYCEKCYTTIKCLGK